MAVYKSYNKIRYNFEMLQFYSLTFVTSNLYSLITFSLRTSHVLHVQRNISNDQGTMINSNQEVKLKSV